MSKHFQVHAFSGKKQILCHLVFAFLIFVLFDTEHSLQHLLNPFVMDFGEVSF
jgi:hypothetical protein